MKYKSLRRLRGSIRLVGRRHEDYDQELQDAIWRLWQKAEKGIPAGFNGVMPTTVTMGGVATPGTVFAGWMAADAQLVVDAAAPSSPPSLGSSPAAGSATTGLRSDMVLDGRTLAAQVRACVSLRVG